MNQPLTLGRLLSQLAASGISGKNLNDVILYKEELREYEDGTLRNIAEPVVLACWLETEAGHLECDETIDKSNILVLQ